MYSKRQRLSPNLEPIPESTPKQEVRERKKKKKKGSRRGGGIQRDLYTRSSLPLIFFSPNSQSTIHTNSHQNSKQTFLFLTSTAPFPDPIYVCFGGRRKSLNRLLSTQNSEPALVNSIKIKNQNTKYYFSSSHESRPSPSLTYKDIFPLSSSSAPLVCPPCLIPKATTAHLAPAACSPCCSRSSVRSLQEPVP